MLEVRAITILMLAMTQYQSSRKDHIFQLS